MTVCKRQWTILGVILFIALTGAPHGCSTASNANTSLDRQLTGVTYITRVAALVHALQKYRSLAIAFVEDDGSVEFAPTEQRISETLTSIDRFDAQHPELPGVHERWIPLKNQVRDLVENWREQPRERFARYTELISAALAFVAYVGEVSTLRADTTPEVQSLVDAATAVIPELTEAMGQTSDLVNSIAGQNGMVREQERAVFNRHVTTIRSRLDQIKSDYEKVYALDEHVRSQLDPQRETVGQLTGGVLEMLDKQVLHVDYIQMPPDVWTPRATAAIESTQTLQDLSLTTLQARLTARKKSS